MLKPIDPKTIDQNVFSLIGEKWMLITAGIHHLLLTGVEGVALGAHLHADVLLGRTSLNHVAAGAPDGGLLIIGMNSCLHCIFTSFSMEDRL